MLSPRFLKKLDKLELLFVSLFHINSVFKGCLRNWDSAVIVFLIDSKISTDALLNCSAFCFTCHFEHFKQVMIAPFIHKKTYFVWKTSRICW